MILCVWRANEVKPAPRPVEAALGLWRWSSNNFIIKGEGIMFKTLIVGAALLLSIVSLAQADSDSKTSSIESYRQQGYSVKSIAPIFSQLLMTSSPQGFKTVFENTRGTQYIRESVLDGENTNKWTEMITITGAKDLASNPNVSPKKFVESLAGGFKRACPDSFSASGISEGKISGYDGYIAIVSCGISPSTAGQTSESAIIAVIKGERDYYTVQWAERAMPSKTPIVIDATKWTDKFKKLAPIKLCPIIPGESAPYPSCAGSKRVR